jgi:UDP-N-acetylmuramate dehydrogenase
MTAQVRHDVPLAPLTTLRVGGPARELVAAESTSALIDAVADADARGVPALPLAGGSNVVVADSGFDGRVVLVRTRGIEVTKSDCAGAWVTVAAGESWDALTARAAVEGWVGIEALAGIPGSVGATPIQNVGAYGQEVAGTIARVEVFDRATRERRLLAVADCGFGYRSSRFKSYPRFVILAVTFQLRLGTLSEPIAYAELAQALGVEVGARAPIAEVRDAVLRLRSAKGMVLDDADHDTWSVGSFFTNPVVASENLLPVGAPRWEVDGGVKTSAAWLIERAGFARGYGLPGSHAALSDKHTLAITNRGGASTAEITELARTVRDGVRAAFGIHLEPEPTLVGWLL